MKSQTYTYEKGETKLSFSFSENEKIEQNKKDFINLMKEATDELKKEIN